ncbi:hypothetical protein BJ165DRAFT_802017 [Panaeolus papilionaceus]|nr:hypothetical protein BJ165DRAFT_802017 [Panaeolus papilionaceus]
MNSEPKLNSYPEGLVLRFPALKSSGESETSVHQVPTARSIDPPVTPTPSVTPISTTTPPSLAVPLPLVRQRTAQACDKCRERKTKCSGQRPCARCVARGLLCKYSVRESRHRSPFRGIRGSGGPSGKSRSAERSRYIDSSTRTVSSNTSISVPTYRIHPSNPNFSSTPAFAQRSYLDERIPSQHYHMSQHITQGVADSTHSTQEGPNISNRLQGQWQQEGQRAQAKYVGYGYEDRRNARTLQRSSTQRILDPARPCMEATTSLLWMTLLPSYTLT